MDGKCKKRSKGNIKSSLKESRKNQEKQKQQNEAKHRQKASSEAKFMLQSNHILLTCRCFKSEKAKNKSNTLLHQVVLKVKISKARVYKRMG